MTFSILSFSKGLVNSLKNKASKKRFKLILSRVMQHNSLNLWSISKNRSEFVRAKIENVFKFAKEALGGEACRSEIMHRLKSLYLCFFCCCILLLYRRQAI